MIDPCVQCFTRSRELLAVDKCFFLFFFSKKKTIFHVRSARALSRKIITAFIRIEFIPRILYVPSYLYPPSTPLLLSGIKKISLTVGQTDGWVSCLSYRERVARRRPWARLLNLRFSRSSRILRVPPRKRYCYNRRGVFEENRVAPRRPMAGTGRRKRLYRRPVYWVACDRWKKVSLSAASSEIPRRPWRTTQRLSRFRFR